MTVDENTWIDANQRYLIACVAEVKSILEAFLARADGGNPAEESLRTHAEARARLLSEMTPPPPLETLAGTFGLSAFERKILLLCAGVELDSHVAELCAAFDKRAAHRLPVFSLALAAFGDAHWSALSPTRPLRRWQLIEILPGDALTTSPLRIDERVLHYITGVRSIDERLRSVLTIPGAIPAIAPSHLAIAREISAVWSRRSSALPIVQLCGDEVSAKRAIAAAAAAAFGIRLQFFEARGVRAGLTDLGVVTRLVEREAVLTSSALMVECDEAESALGVPETVLVHLIESLHFPVILAARSPRQLERRATVVFDVSKPKPAEQAEIWRRVLEPACPGVNGELSGLVAQFSFSPVAIQSAAEQALDRAVPLQNGELSLAKDGLAERLWEICRVQARPRLEGLAQRIDAAAVWDDLVLPERQKNMLHEIALHVRHRARVYQEWGFASRGVRGLGISALFAGPSGTGKTMAGEVLANELRLDLYRIDLSQVVSKYIGETEKNLRRVFDAAEDGAAILLFDEADALFGKRSEVKDSHDRYANIEVSYLLQRMESYRGLAILTTNRKSALDQAFLRRLRFVVEFPFPDAQQRVEIWRRVFPAKTPTEGLRIDRLAHLNAAGGHIRNIAMCAAFLASDADEPVRMPHLLAAARSEFNKLEKPLADAETAGWV